MADLTDKEITEACARARGYVRVMVFESHPLGFAAFDKEENRWVPYNPLTDRAQALELVEKLRLRMQWLLLSTGVIAEVQTSDLNEPGPYANGKDADLLRAICLCAARVQIEKEKKGA